MGLNITVIKRDELHTYLNILQEEFLWTRKSKILGKLVFERDKTERENLTKSIELLDKNYKINFFITGELPFNETDSETLLNLWKNVDPKDWPDGVIVDEEFTVDILFADLSRFKFKRVGELLGSIMGEEDRKKIDKILHELEVFSQNFSKVYTEENGLDY